MLQDLLVAAHADAKRKVEALTAEEMQKRHRRPEPAARHEAAVLKPRRRDPQQWAALKSSG